MDIFTDLEALDLSARPHPRILTAGVFDGLHRAHQRLVERAVFEARRAAPRGCACVFTFSNHPLSVLAPAYAPKSLLSTPRKAELFERLGVDILVMPAFTPTLAALAPADFVREILANRCGLDRIIIGFDFRFGRGAAGDARFLRTQSEQYGFDVEVLPAVCREDLPVSSTRIRECILEGRVREAMDMLGRPYELAGPVVHGFGRGTQLGFPTANLVFDPVCAVPASGVYAVFAEVGGRLFPAMMNIGLSPTFEGTEYRPEVFLFDYAGGPLYGETVRVLFVERLREERKYPGVQALLERLHVDERMARAVLEALPEEMLRAAGLEE